MHISSRSPRQHKERRFPQWINTISPTWFVLTGNEGDFTSFASKEYVNAAHGKGLEVWKYSGTPVLYSPSRESDFHCVSPKALSQIGTSQEVDVQILMEDGTVAANTEGDVIEDAGYVISRYENDVLYVAADFVKRYANFSYELGIRIFLYQFCSKPCRRDH